MSGESPSARPGKPGRVFRNGRRTRPQRSVFSGVTIRLLRLLAATLMAARSSSHPATWRACSTSRLPRLTRVAPAGVASCLGIAASAPVRLGRRGGSERCCVQPLRARTPRRSRGPGEADRVAHWNLASHGHLLWRMARLTPTGASRISTDVALAATSGSSCAMPALLPSRGRCGARRPRSESPVRWNGMGNIGASQRAASSEEAFNGVQCGRWCEA